MNGPGSLTKPERERKARDIIAESGADTPECLAHAEGISTGVTLPACRQIRGSICEGRVVPLPR
jgi:hypothetical protein